MFYLSSMLITSLLIVPFIYLCNIVYHEYETIKYSIEKGREELAELNMQLKSIQSIFSFFGDHNNTNEETNKSTEEKTSISENNSEPVLDMPISGNKDEDQDKMLDNDKNKDDNNQDELILLSLDNQDPVSLNN